MSLRSRQWVQPKRSAEGFKIFVGIPRPKKPFDSSPQALFDHAEAFVRRADHEIGQAEFAGISHLILYRIWSDAKTLTKRLVRHAWDQAKQIAGLEQRVETLSAKVATLEKENNVLSQQITIDPLTGLGNRAAFNLVLAHESRAAARNDGLSVLITDIDGLKNLNTQWGHAKADKVLIAFGDIVQQCIRAGDEATRFGGDEFCVILPNCLPEVAIYVAEFIRVATKELADRLGLPFSVSIGLVSSKGDLTSDEVYKHADVAAYGSKDGAAEQKKGTNIRFIDETGQPFKDRVTVGVGKLGKAGDAEMILTVQPHMDLETLYAKHGKSNGDIKTMIDNLLANPKHEFLRDHAADFAAGKFTFGSGAQDDDAQIAVTGEPERQAILTAPEVARNAASWRSKVPVRAAM